MGEHYARCIPLTQGETHNGLLYSYEVSSPSARLKAARIAARYDSAPAAAAAMGIPEQTYMAHENGNRSFRRAVERYAKFFRVAPEWLLFGNGQGPRDVQAPLPAPANGPPVSGANLKAWVKAPAVSGRSSRQTAKRHKPVLRSIPVLGEVAAGVWRETSMSKTEEVDDYLPVDVPGYERAALWALRVSGPSMDLFYPQGGFVIVASPAEAGLRVGDHVVCEREQTGLIEITLKELVMVEGRHALMPRSSHPDFQGPVFLSAAGDYDQTAPRIVGVVVANYSRRERPAIMFSPYQEGSE